MEREKSQGKRSHRRRRKSKVQKAKISNASPNLGTYKKPTAKPKQEFIEEENEIQKLIKEKENLKSKKDELSKVDLEIMFFESAIPRKEEDEQEEKDSASVKTNDSIKTISNIPESPTHMASSYLVFEEVSVTKKVSPEDVAYDETLLYIPGIEEEEVPELEAGPNIFKQESHEEGTYEFFKPNIRNINRAQMINRCLEEGNSDCLQMIENGPSLCDILFMLPKHDHLFKGHSSKKFHPIFVKPEPISKTFSLHENINKTLNIYVHSVVFNQHPNLSENLLLVKKLKQLYDHYVHFNEHEKEIKLQSKLNGLRYVRSQMTDDDIKMEVCKLQIKETRNELYTISKQNKELLLKILETWRHLKQTQGGNNSGLALKIHCVDKDVEEDREKWEYDFDVALNELVEENFEEYLRKKQEYKAIIRTNKNQEMEKPKKPDMELLRQDLLRMWSESFRQPGEPDITLEMEKSTEATLKSVGLKYIVKIYADGDVVTSTKPKELLTDFKLHIDTSYAIKLTTRMIRDLKVEIIELSDMRTSHKISDVYAIIPSSDENFNEIDYNDYEFSSKKIRGQRIHGKIIMKCGWVSADQDHDRNGSSVELLMPKKAEIPKDTVRTWHQQQLIDPLDPDSHSALKSLLHERPLNVEQRAKTREFNLNEEDLAFCSQEELDNNERLNMLRARFERDLKFKNTTFIPSNEREIEKPDYTSMFEEIIGDPIDIQRHEGKKYLKKVYETITNHCDNLNASREKSAILIGDQIPTFGYALLRI